jgi:hypothetical protein
MRRSRIQTFVVLGSFGLFAAACAPDDTQPADAVPELTTPATTPETPGVAAAPADQAVTANITPLAGSGITGEVLIEPAADATHVSVTLHGAEAGQHQGHIHTGTCAQPGGVVAPLEPVTLSDAGHGTAMATVDVPAATLRDGRHIVVYHEAGGSPGAPVACAEIPAT